MKRDDFMNSSTFTFKCGYLIFINQLTIIFSLFRLGLTPSDINESYDKSELHLGIQWILYCENLNIDQNLGNHHNQFM